MRNKFVHFYNIKKNKADIFLIIQYYSYLQ